MLAPRLQLPPGFGCPFGRAPRWLRREARTSAECACNKRFSALAQLDLEELILGVLGEARSLRAEFNAEPAVRCVPPLGIEGTVRSRSYDGIRSHSRPFTRNEIVSEIDTIFRPRGEPCIVIPPPLCPRWPRVGFDGAEQFLARHARI